MISNRNIIFIMGVSGSGKSTVGRLLADQLSIAFVDADDHHPPSNIKKMSQGVPLSDSDRVPWLEQINKIAINHLESGVVIACSALKKQYRVQLNQFIESKVHWVYLKGDYDLIYQRIKKRRGHFMNADMLRSQFETLQESATATTIDIANPVEQIIEKISDGLLGK